MNLAGLTRMGTGLIVIVGLSLTLWVYAQQPFQVGYAALTVVPGVPAPVATALFSYPNRDGVLVSQAGVTAVEPIVSGTPGRPRTTPS